MMSFSLVMRAKAIGRIVLVGHARVAVDVGEVFFLELGHQLLDDGIVLAIAFDLVRELRLSENSV